MQNYSMRLTFLLFTLLSLINAQTPTECYSFEQCSISPSAFCNANGNRKLLKVNGSFGVDQPTWTALLNRGPDPLLYIDIYAVASKTYGKGYE